MIGGTRFVGLHVAEAALAAGHDVTVFHRGRTGPDLLPGATHLTGDRNADLSALAEGRWDATVDACAYFPRQVHELAEVLGDRAGHYLLVSSVSVYDVPDRPGFDEDARLIELDDPTVEEITEETYGGLKVLCERAAVERFGPQTLLVRPTFVVGPDDYTWRFPWWVQRLARGGEVLAPGPADAPAQLIDARDMGTWMVGLLERAESGPFHAVGPSGDFTFGRQLEAIAAEVAPDGTSLTWVDEDFLLGEGVDGAALPLWSGGDPYRLQMTADPSRAFATGLRPRPLADTVRDTLAWLATQQQPSSPGLSAEREAALLTRWHAR